MDPTKFQLYGQQIEPGNLHTEYYRSVCDRGDWLPTTEICTKNGSFDDDHPDIPTAGWLVWRDRRKANRCGDFGRRKQCHNGNYQAVQLSPIRHQDPAVCPVFNGVTAARADPLTPGAYDPAHRVICTYDAEALAGNCEAATQWTLAKRKELAGPGGTPDTDWYHFDLMEGLCGRVAPGGEGCPSTSKGYVGPDGKPICSNLNACGLCRDWATTNAQGVDTSSRLIREYCDAQLFDPKHYDNPAKSDPSCKCYRIRDRPGLPRVSGPVGCWYAMCQDNGLTNYLVPPSDRLDLSQVDKCPDICSEVINIIDAGVVDIGDITMTCGHAPPGPGPGPSGGSWWGRLTDGQRAAVGLAAASVLVGLGGALVAWGAPGQGGAPK